MNQIAFGSTGGPFVVMMSMMMWQIMMMMIQRGIRDCWFQTTRAFVSSAKNPFFAGSNAHHATTGRGGAAPGTRSRGFAI